jgi:transmembrane sensor
MDVRRRTNFLTTYAEDQHTEAEHAEFLSWVRNAGEDEVATEMEAYRQLCETRNVKFLPDPQLIAKLESRLDESDMAAEHDTGKFRFRRLYRAAAAAVIVCVLSAALYMYVDSPDVQPVLAGKPEIKKSVTSDVAPGSNTALLTLADGSKIVLDDAVNGEIALQAGIHIKKTADGQIIYDASAVPANTPGAHLFNTISTPRGGQYQINLPDGSRVWLNAASSLKYPLRFDKGERRVILSGEAYFEVAHKQAMPFRVESGGQLVEVFGTKFNINSYENEQLIKTTLLEGSVKVTSTLTSSSAFLKPGQESNTTPAGSLTLAAADITQAVSWKNGSFVFNDMDLVNIMRQLERWYDVDMDYSNIPSTRYNGNISRSVNLSKVLRMLEVTGKVKFKIEGKKIKID